MKGLKTSTDVWNTSLISNVNPVFNLAKVFGIFPLSTSYDSKLKSKILKASGISFPLLYSIIFVLYQIYWLSWFSLKAFAFDSEEDQGKNAIDKLKDLAWGSLGFGILLALRIKKFFTRSKFVNLWVRCEALNSKLFTFLEPSLKMKYGEILKQLRKEFRTKIAFILFGFIILIPVDVHRNVAELYDLDSKDTVVDHIHYVLWDVFLVSYLGSSLVILFCMKYLIYCFITLKLCLQRMIIEQNWTVSTIKGEKEGKSQNALFLRRCSISENNSERMKWILKFFKETEDLLTDFNDLHSIEYSAEVITAALNITICAYLTIQNIYFKQIDGYESELLPIFIVSILTSKDFWDYCSVGNLLGRHVAQFWECMEDVQVEDISEDVQSKVP